MKIKKLNTKGIAHIIAPLLVVLAIGVAGTFAIVSSSAATKRVPTGRVTVKAYEQSSASLCTASPAKLLSKSNPGAYAEWKKECRLVKAIDTDLYVEVVDTVSGNKPACVAVTTATKSTTLVPLSKGAILKLGANRSVSCTPGIYKFALARGTNLDSLHNPNKIKASKVEQVTISSTQRQTISLGTVRAD